MKPRNQDNVDKIKKEIGKHRRGIWINQLARDLDMIPTTLIYYIWGFEYPSRSKSFGGYLREIVKVEKTEGKNRYIRLKTRKELKFVKEKK